MSAIVIDPRVFLRRLIAEWEAEVGSITRSELRKQSSSGVMPAWRGHLALAVIEAREALASDDQSEITAAAMLCQARERTGMKVLLHSKTKVMRSNGGKKRGEQQKAASADLWRPYQSRYEELLREGKKPSTARAIIAREMTRNEFTLPGQNRSPSARIIRERLK
jgi:hypothetical protein